ncbi:bifunctional molybdopterin-guanine dinucleotide biosynthesis adaptor protein MobB/molybdopterin molybdotransferase MoeA [Shewanella sp. D64]|uniref:bifunctional molybdopterin-guanine dinucleotide biosynthesis adaptor protein MobB/molybdopterin molybdotransferase MoeA n=1 Tax=unclassified Shewanella TaxID=196818 RepID=UPI0022BA3ABF|nr:MULTISPECIES: bifunctional molybdopterin-guanine dinucleotide biosynthesis adaptor protein MobB/molybdopterin molybdotransferase MoeA [unclassified Shewanella]MEC4727586.1 bifunctional molybdopterin-guanine dinucleotide biosynthesis adaptor protein MobB/molybdopterin molybdotransferase MoeA [Shewanella sp. D64]MEC4739837.1 bifunctional molybdopterin-guanine dinucleotide biosynthesis adaptor protein MobB/molybdopterin molybdotransferase MoeA [Shewanella sp. E94]WBJ95777.1 bifunctional molybdop
MSTPFTNPLSIPVLGFCAYSGTGKTTLLKKLIPELSRRGVKLAVIKHAHHNFDVDTPGKDSYEMRKAGARQMLVASHIRWALMTEDEVDGDPQLPHLLQQIEQDKVDIVLVEGFKKLELPKIELHRAAHGKPFIHTHDTNIQAIACCDETVLPGELRRLDINNVEQIADFVIEYAKSWQPNATSVPLAPQAPECGCEVDSSKTLSVRQGIDSILSFVKPVSEYEVIELDELNGRVLAQDAISPVDVPQQTNSAMDGYAFKHSVPMLPSYTVVADVLAGHQYAKTLQQGEAVRIMTGAPVPAGADTVQMKELATDNGDSISFQGDIALGQHVRLAGEDIAKGKTALAAHNRLQAPEQGMLASLGFGQLPVFRRPKVAVFSTGDEVCQPGEPLKPSCIYDSNRFTIKSMVRKLGCEVIDLGIIHDSEEVLVAALSQAAVDADVVISSGGVSVGDADFIKLALEKVGQINFWRINMRPGRPLAFGQIGNSLFFGLPGNPVAVMVSFMQFVQPALRKLAGEKAWTQTMVPAIADCKMRSRIGRTEFIRGIFHLAQDGKLHVTTTGAQGSGMLSSMVQGNCFIVIGEQDEQLNSGDVVYIQPFADLL